MMNPKDDAKGQFAKSQAEPQPDGVISAKPTVITGSQDATVNRFPDEKKPGKDWDVNYDEIEPDHSR
ncbi:hypothetical protein [Pararhizobium antarcticum]|uniref:Uncharacterized protein n=1 Tax=Pararhizobium antarcticum TaxID=1798805 RepID=A0A657LUK1_9HYPH|nr:hypothetical protein [Pararhizobium antarcticum]OJF96229.1 hypothetical protein AX761_16095 [Rhizobium sp. 58]OJF97772.1 hypothetical protein AX760_16055 [Pararhizobium antarcticum]